MAPLPPPSGGIAGWTLRMQTTKLKNGWTVDIVDEKLIGERGERGGGYKKSVRVEFERSRRIWKELKRYLQSEDARIVQACIPATSGAMLREIVSAKLTHQRNRRFITHFRCTVPYMVKTRVQHLLLKMLVRNSDCVFCLNQQTEDCISSLDCRANYVTIPNFVDFSETFDRKEYRDIIKKLVYTGRILEEKGCKRILEVAAECPGIQFELIGKVLMETDHIPANAILTGEKDKEFIQQELRDADAFIFLTRFPGEGFSNSLAEAMAYSLPCIVTDWAANRDMIGNDGGVVLQDASVDQVRDAIRRIEAKAVREEMGKRNYLTVLSKYTQQTITDMYVDEYEKLDLKCCR